MGEFRAFLERAVIPQGCVYGAEALRRRAEEFREAERKREAARRALWPRRLQLLVEDWRRCGDGPYPPLV